MTIASFFLLFLVAVSTLYCSKPFAKSVGNVVNYAHSVEPLTAMNGSKDIIFDGVTSYWQSVQDEALECS